MFEFSPPTSILRLALKIDSLGKEGMDSICGEFPRESRKGLERNEYKFSVYRRCMSPDNRHRIRCAIG